MLCGVQWGSTGPRSGSPELTQERGKVNGVRGAQQDPAGCSWAKKWVSTAQLGQQGQEVNQPGSVGLSRTKKWISEAHPGQEMAQWGTVGQGIGSAELCRGQWGSAGVSGAKRARGEATRLSGAKKWATRLGGLSRGVSGTQQGSARPRCGSAWLSGCYRGSAGGQ